MRVNSAAVVDVGFGMNLNENLDVPVAKFDLF